MPNMPLSCWAARRQVNLLASRQLTQTAFVLRREPFYHKLRYAKVPKFDIAAPTLGAVCGAFVAYVGLATFGSSGTDLADLTTLVWYVVVWLTNIRLLLLLAQEPSRFAKKGGLALQVVYELGGGFGVEAARLTAGMARLRISLGQRARQRSIFVFSWGGVALLIFLAVCVF